MVAWRDYAGGISESAQIELDSKLQIFNNNLSELSKAQIDATIACASLVSWAELGLKVIEIAGPIISQSFVRPIDEPEAIIVEETETQLDKTSNQVSDAIVAFNALIKILK